MGILSLSRRRTTKAMPNPLDKSTVVSIFPREINEVKHTIEPGRFHIDAGTYENPAILVVGTSSWWKEIDDEQPFLEIPTSSILIADSIVRDYCNGLLGCNMGALMPGLFFVPGSHSLAVIKKDYKDKLDIANTKQRAWFTELVKLADILWSRTNGNPLVISNHMKLAAEQLNFKNKPWLKDFMTLELTNCPACGFLRNNAFPVCSNCKTILDKEQFKKLGLEVAS